MLVEGYDGQPRVFMNDKSGTYFLLNDTNFGGYGTENALQVRTSPGLVNLPIQKP